MKENIINIDPSKKAGITEIFYYGTALDCAGHFHWKLCGDRMTKTNVPFNSLPFNPDDLINLYVSKGIAKYFMFGDYKVVSITGSCFDSRSGTKSVLYTTEDVDLSELGSIIMSIPMANKIISQMPFTVDWEFDKAIIKIKME